ncbi:MAG: permease prefix domain 1-containing protein [Planctomycetota bacterium]
MFNLENEIRHWHRSMLARLPLHRDSIAELESHLRDAVQANVQAGMSSRDAWTTACSQLGSPDALAAEYLKLSKCCVWHWLPAKTVLGVYGLMAILLMALLASRVSSGKTELLLAVHVLAITLGYSAVFAVSAITTWSILSRAFSGWSHVETEILGRTIRAAAIASLTMTAIGVMTGCLWNHGRTGIYWGGSLNEMSGLAVLFWNLLVLGLQAYQRDERTRMLASLTGAIVVATCWFGTVLAQRASDYGVSMTASSPVILAGVALLALVGMTLLPAGRLRFYKSA